ncbi:hypothetical protein QEZ54_11750 [Catellatospora sp. KI3]|nr:hypothetical protein [Catellatospora sp. KI3]MDI1461648.1 hypothetical protein [Catellatospora sp. KI3]
MATWVRLTSTELLAAGNPTKSPFGQFLFCAAAVALAVGLLVYATRGDRR